MRTSLTSVALVEYEDSAERMWCTLHTNIGTILLGNWYRAPDENGSSLLSLTGELRRLREDVVGTILVGDLNVHHKHWLKHSSDNTSLGERLWGICRDSGLKQLVREPTRGQYLLDLVLTDMPEISTVNVLPELTDHRIVSIDIEVVVPHFDEVPRTVWDLEHAGWEELKAELSSTAWANLLDPSDPDASANRFCRKLEGLCDRYIPRKTISSRTTPHPWLNEECFRAIDAKCQATSPEELKLRAHVCSETLTRTFLNYQTQLRARIASLPRSSKDWWKLNRELLNRKTKVSTIAPLKDTQGKWVLDPAGKANLLATTFQCKSKLPPGIDRQPCSSRDPLMSDFQLIRSRWVLRILKALKVGKASGPDGLPVRIFKECCVQLAPAIALLIRFLLRARRWPDIWRHHRVHPLFKKGAVSKPQNYRGVHLTDVISKIVERTIAMFLTPFFERVGAFGKDQWAFRKKHSCKDLVALLVCRWLWALDNGFKVGIYLSDISGAFDKVDRMLFTDRLREIGLSTALVEFLHDYLAPRQAKVVVQGHESKSFVIDNELFQGTVLGPPLWNVYFDLVDAPIRRKLFNPAKFADDMTAYRNYEANTSNAVILAQLAGCQSEVHEWGASKRVTFDEDKEHFSILHRGDPCGETFRLLGTLVDPKLAMLEELQRIRKKASPKLNAILAARRFYDIPGLMQQYKSHVLCLLEASTAAVYHAAPTHLDSIDSIQRRFLKELELTEADAFLRFNLAPLQMRRDIGVLGLLHKVQLGEAHPDFDSIFPKLVDAQPANTRRSLKRHGRQLHEQYGATDYFNRSVFAAVRVYNILPSYVANASAVTDFQSMLTKDAKHACRTGARNWQNLYNKRLL